MFSSSKKNLNLELLSYLLLIILIISVIFLYFFDTNEYLYNKWLFDRNSFFVNKLNSVTYIFFHNNIIQLSINLSSILMIYIFLGRVFESIWWFPALILSGVTAAYGVFFYDLETNLITGLTAAIHGLIFYALLYLRVSLLWFAILVCKLIVDLYFFGFFSKIFNYLYTTTELYSTSPVANIFSLAGSFFVYAISRSIALLSVIIELNKQNYK